MEGEVFTEIVYSKNVIEFATVANEFCVFVEAMENFSRKEFLIRTQKFFPLLYLKTTLIPKLNEENEDETPEKFVSEADYNYIQQKLAKKLGEFDTYQEVFDQQIHISEAPIEASIAENITDIYQDLKDFILAYRIGTVEVMNAALSECCNNFEQYWGQKLVNGLRAIHQLVYSDANLDKV